MNFHTSVGADGETTMDDSNIFETLGQVSSGDAATIFRDFLRGSVEAKNVKPNSPGVGRSNVSRHWQEAGHPFVEQLRGGGS
jgi:hypothetical protein